MFYSKNLQLGGGGVSVFLELGGVGSLFFELGGGVFTSTFLEKAKLKNVPSLGVEPSTSDF